MYSKKRRYEVNTKIEYMPPYKIAYIRKIGPYGSENVETMQKLKNWVKENGLLDEESIILGIPQDNPNTTKPQYCRYDTCFVLSDDKALNGNEVKVGKIIGGKHCVFEIEHTAEAMHKAWNEIFPELKHLGYQLDETRPIIERYLAAMVNKHLCEICIPIT